MKNAAGIGYAIGMLIVVPLLIWGANYFFYSGNRASKEQVQEYINNSFIEKFFIKKEDWLDNGYISYTPKLSRRGGDATYIWYLFYDENYKKFFWLSTFNYVHPSDKEIGFIIGRTESAEYKVYINKDQLNNPDYGTKDNPIPIWPVELTDKEISFNSEATHLYIGQYLSHFMPKEEYKEMFKK